MHISVLDRTGRTVIDVLHAIPKAEVSISQLASGAYTVRVELNSGKVLRMVFVKL